MGVRGRAPPRAIPLPEITSCSKAASRHTGSYLSHGRGVEGGREGEGKGGRLILVLMSLHDCFCCVIASCSKSAS